MNCCQECQADPSWGCKNHHLKLSLFRPKEKEPTITANSQQTVIETAAVQEHVHMIVILSAISQEVARQRLEVSSRNFTGEARATTWPLVYHSGKK